MGARVIYAMSRDGLFFRSRLPRQQRRHAHRRPSSQRARRRGTSPFSVSNASSPCSPSSSSPITCSPSSRCSSSAAASPTLPRPYRAWGYPWTTALALLGSIGFLDRSHPRRPHQQHPHPHRLACSYPVYRVLNRLRSLRIHVAPCLQAGIAVGPARFLAKAPRLRGWTQISCQQSRHPPIKKGGSHPPLFDPYSLNFLSSAISFLTHLLRHRLRLQEQQQIILPAGL